MNTGIELLKNVPYLTKENYGSVLPYKSKEANDGYFSDLQILTRILKEKYGGEVNGLWFIRVPSVDGGAQTITRTKTKFDAVRHNQLAADVFDFCRDEMGYIITNDSIKGVNSIPIEEWIAEGQIFAVFDIERERK